MDRVVVNAATGEQTVVPLTAAEIAALPGPGPVVYPPLPVASFWLAALEVGVTKASVLTTVNAMPDPTDRERTRIMVEDTRIYRREDPLINALAAGQGITSTQLDSLWLWAAAL